VQAAYHGGRLFSYVLLGVLAGAMGQLLDQGGELFQVQRVSMMVAGVVMILFGVVALLRIWGARIGKMGVPKPLQALFARGTAFAQSRHPVVRALLIGLLSIFLPCGWLYFFVFAAAGTGSALFGAYAMAAFWLGTVPILAAMGVGIQMLTGPVRKHLPWAMALLLIIVGVVVVVRGEEVRAIDGPMFASESEERSIDEALDRVKGVESADLPCCAEPEDIDENAVEDSPEPEESEDPAVEPTEPVE
jgi:sulfite exporter TauE/SafE